MNDRILLILKHKNINAAKFAEELDVQRSGISHLLAGRNKPSLELIQKILKSYPEISPEWLISGKGAMLKNPELFVPEIDIPKPVAETKNETSVKEKTTIDKESADKKEQSAHTILSTLPLLQEPSESSVAAKSQKSKSEKTIEKIVVFYTDSTFKVYSPS